MDNVSGNEYVSRPHPYATWVGWLGAVVGIVLVVWANLATAVQALVPLRGVSLVFAPFRFGAMIYVAKQLFNLHAALGFHVSLNLSQRPSASYDHRVWRAWWTFVVQHAVGSGIHGYGSPAAWALAVNLGLFLLAFGPAAYIARRMSTSPDPSRRPGTSAWSGARELKLYLDAPRFRGSLPLGEIVPSLPGARRPIAIPFKQRMEHVEVLGVTGTGKTGCVFKPWILSDGLLNDTSHPEGAISTVAIDTNHPDIYDAVAPYIAAQPHRLLFVVAPDHPETTMFYNPLDALDPSDPHTYRSEIEALVHTIVENTVNVERGDVPFHRSIETIMLQDLIQFAYEAEPAIDRALAYETLRPFLEPGQEIPRIRSLAFLALLCRLPGQAFMNFIASVVTDPAVPDKWAVRFGQQRDRTKSDLTDTLYGLQRRLAAFMSPNVIRVTQASHFSLEAIGQRPSTLIIGTPRSSGEATQTFSAIMITQLIHHLTRVAIAQPSQRLPVPVMIYLDEVINQARIPGLEQHVATLRKYGIGFVIGLQDHAGLRQRYTDNGAQALLSNLKTRIIFGRDLLPQSAATDILPFLGDTTLVTHGAVKGDRGTSVSEHVVKRPLMTVDQIRKMRFGEVIAILHGNCMTRTRMPLMPRRDPETGQWRYDKILDADVHAICKPIVDLLSTLPVEPPLIDPLRQRYREAGVSDAQILFEKMARLGVHPPVSAGPQGSPSRAAGDLSPLTATQVAANGATHNGPSHQRIDEAVRRLVEAAEQKARELRGQPSSETAAHAQPSPGDGPVTIEPAEQSHASAQGQASAATTQAAEREKQRAAVNQDRVMDEVRGLYNSLLVRHDLLPPGSPPRMWRLSDGTDAALAIATDVVTAYALRRSTKLEKLLATWESAGLARSIPVTIQDGRRTVEVIVLTKEAVREDRLTPALRDRIRAFPEITPAGQAGRQAAQQPPVRPPHARPEGGQAKAHRSGDPREVLQAVVRWARAHRKDLVTPGSDPIGQWDVTVGDTPVLLVRGVEAWRLLGEYADDARKILRVWKDSGILVTSDAPSEASDNRFTIFARTPEGQQTGTRYMAFRWEALEQAGLRRDGQPGEPGSA